jgi:hypothetical protein
MASRRDGPDNPAALAAPRFLTTDNIPGTPVAALPAMTRRLLALFGFIAVIVLAVTLLYRVYVHHVESEPYDDEETTVVRLESKNCRGLLLNYSSVVRS